MGVFSLWLLADMHSYWWENKYYTLLNMDKHTANWFKSVLGEYSVQNNQKILSRFWSIFPVKFKEFLREIFIWWKCRCPPLYLHNIPSKIKTTASADSVLHILLFTFLFSTWRIARSLGHCWCLDLATETDYLVVAIIIAQIMKYRFIF